MYKNQFFIYFFCLTFFVIVFIRIDIPFVKTITIMMKNGALSLFSLRALFFITQSAYRFYSRSYTKQCIKLGRIVVFYSKIKYNICAINIYTCIYTHTRTHGPYSTNRITHSCHMMMYNRI